MRLLKKVETLLKMQHHLTRPVDTRTQIEVLALELERTTADARDIVTRHHTTRCLQCLQFVFGFLTTTAPGRQLIGQVSEQSLEVGYCLLVRSNVW